MTLPMRGGGLVFSGKPSYTPQQAADALTRSGREWAAGTDGVTTVTYAFRSGGDVPGGGTFAPFYPEQMGSTELALASWSDVANIRFVRIGSGTTREAAYSNNATMLFGNYTGDETGAAFALFPGNPAASSQAGDVWIRGDLSYNIIPHVGDYGQQVLVHEIGHAIGLAHPSDYDASDEFEATYSASASYYEDSRQYTLMSYFGSSNTGGAPNVFSASPQIDDILAAQRLYGANYATRAGDTTYGFNSNADRPYFVAASAATDLYFAVWDGGGYDRLDFSGYSQNQEIDLRPGAFSSVGGATYNVAIAPGVAIEEAIGGSGRDTLTGGDASEALIGGGGADSINAGDGNDHLFGGGRAPVENDGPDTLNAGAGNDYVQGNAGIDVISGGSGSDRIFGGQGNDSIRGDQGNDTINGNLGNDDIDGGFGNDSLRGGQGNDRIGDGWGDDLLLGDLGNDSLFGGDGIDNLFGGEGDDRLNGGDDQASDYLTGGQGADVFVPDLTGGADGLGDLVLDFQDGLDRLAARTLPMNLAYASFGASTAAAEIAAYARSTLTVAGSALAIGWQSDTLVFVRSTDAFDSLRLAGIADPSTITIADFI